MANNVRFVDSIKVGAYGTGGGSSISSSYALTSSYSSYAVSASYAISSSHEIIKEVSSSHADTASFAQSGDGIFSGSFSGSFQGDGSGLIGLSTDTDIAVTYFISPSGSDSTGTIGDLHKPFKTITAAVDQAVIDALTNPLIYVFPGTYTDASIQFEGGTFFFTSGVSLTGPPQYHGTTGLTGVNQGTKTFTTPGNFASHFNIPGKKIKIMGGANLGIYTVVSAADNGPDTDVVVSEAIPSATFAGDRLTDAIALFEVGTPASSNPIIYGHNSDNIKVYGEVSTNIPATIDGDWSGGFCNAYSGSNAYLEIHDITVEQAVGVSTWSDAILTLKGEYFNVTDKGYAALVQDESDTVFNFQRIISSGSYSFFYREGDSSTYTGTSRVELEELQGVGSSTSGFTFYKVDTGSRIFVECTDIYMSAGASYGISNFFHSGGDIKVTGNITSPLGLMNYYGTVGNLRFNGNLIVSSNPTLPFVWIGSSNTYINGDIYHNDTPTTISEGIKIDGGTLRLNGKIQNDTVGGLGINKTGGTLLIDNSRLITDSYSISSSVAQDVFINNSLSTNTSASSDITFIGPGIYTSDQTGQIINTNLSSSATSTASFGTYIGDGSQLTGIVSSSYALTASYAVSASHEIIKEISSSHADTASFAQSGNGIFSGSFSGSYQGDGSQLTGITAATNLTQSLFVSPSGDDGTAVVGDLHLPFKTISGATGSANVGDTIIVYPGTYIENNNLYVDGVNYHFIDGAVVKATSPVEPMWGGGSGQSNVAGTSYSSSISITGHGEFISEDSTALTSAIFFLNVPSGLIEFKKAFKKGITTYGTIGRFDQWAQEDLTGTLTIRGNFENSGSVSSYGNCLSLGGGNFTVNNTVVRQHGGTGTAVYLWSYLSDLNADMDVYSEGEAVKISERTQNLTVLKGRYETLTTNQGTYYAINGSYGYRGSVLIDAEVRGAIYIGPGDNYESSMTIMGYQEVSDSPGDGACVITSGHNLLSQKIYGVGSNAAFKVTGGVTSFNGYVRLTGNYPLIFDISGGTFFWKGSTKGNYASYPSTYTNPSVVSGGELIIESQLEYYNAHDTGADDDHVFNLSGGTLDIQSKIRTHEDKGNNGIVNMTGGYLKMNGAELVHATETGSFSQAVYLNGGSHSGSILNNCFTNLTPFQSGSFHNELTGGGTLFYSDKLY